MGRNGNQHKSIQSVFLKNITSTINKSSELFFQSPWKFLGASRLELQSKDKWPSSGTEPLRTPVPPPANASEEGTKRNDSGNPLQNLNRANVVNKMRTHPLRTRGISDPGVPALQV